jgi:hypothetical protein
MCCVGHHVVLRETLLVPEPAAELHIASLSCGASAAAAAALPSNYAAVPHLMSRLPRCIWMLLLLLLLLLSGGRV